MLMYSAITFDKIGHTTVKSMLETASSGHSGGILVYME